ncbi:hypothetical protein [Endozoicomonas acroporae]|uniref:hypothetical protein n=1 Tax=Endozoicomonas acroporae TaxID=1701104 RepID=UPI003D78B734
MISQPTAQSTGAATASGSIPVQPGEKWGVWAGVKVAFWDGVIPFLQSWHPDYVPPGAQPDKGPAFTFGSPDGQDSSFFRGVELAARLVSPYTVLPAEIGTMLEGFITLSSAARLRDLFGATKGSSPGQSQADSPMDGSPTNDKGRKKKKPQQTPQRTRPPATASVGPGQLPKAAVALGALSGLSAAAAASPSGNKTEVWIKVPNATTLGKIGRDQDYPLDGKYRQTADIDGSQLNQSIGNKTDPFTGEYDGQCRTISNLSDCFVDTLNGSISHLRFTGANIDSTEVTGLAACVVDVNGTVSNIWAENVHILTNGDKNYAGIGGGEVKGTVGNTTAVNSRVNTTGVVAYAGIGGGRVYRGGTVANTTAVNSRVETSGKSANAGIGGGYVAAGGTVGNTTAVNSTVKTTGEDADAGIGGGDVYGTVANTTAVNSYVNGTQENSGSISNDQLLCQKADPRVLTDNCSLRTEFLDALDVSYSDACPVNAATATTAAALPTVATRRGAVIANTTQVNSFARSTGYSSGVVREPLPTTPAPTVANSTMNVSAQPGATMTLPTPAPTVANSTMNVSGQPGATMTLPTPAPTVANSTMNVSGLTGATMTLPTTVASSAATLSTGAIGRIALGTAAFVVAGVVLGRYIYRRYCCGSYVVDHPQELVAINTVGQAQKARTEPT